MILLAECWRIKKLLFEWLENIFIFSRSPGCALHIYFSICPKKVLFLLFSSVVVIVPFLLQATRLHLNLLRWPLAFTQLITTQFRNNAASAAISALSDNFNLANCILCPNLPCSCRERFPSSFLIQWFFLVQPHAVK